MTSLPDDDSMTAFLISLMRCHDAHRGRGMRQRPRPLLLLLRARFPVKHPAALFLFPHLLFKATGMHTTPSAVRKKDGHSRIDSYCFLHAAQLGLAYRQPRRDYPANRSSGLFYWAPQSCPPSLASATPRILGEFFRLRIGLRVSLSFACPLV